ncbi:MAG TPA: hypothetical protein PLZ57_15570 [Pseudobdellovibrionaceae bacterium]|nr:hypothetical protein [Pseudobdellovibrionaceae bacterium]
MIGRLQPRHGPAKIIVVGDRRGFHKVVPMLRLRERAELFPAPALRSFTVAARKFGFRFAGLAISFGLLASTPIFGTSAWAQASGVATTPHPRSSLLESLAPSAVASSLRNRIASLDVRLGVDLLEGEVMEGVNAAVRYCYQVEPSYKGDYHLRMDRWIMQADVNPGDLLGDYDLSPIGLNLHKGAEILFVRSFKKKSEAFKALPYTPAQIPFTADRIIEKLQVGDFVSLTSNMNLVVSASTALASLKFPASAATHYMISGQFQIHVFKMADGKARLKLIALRKKETGGRVAFGFAHKLRVTGLRVVDRRIEKILDFHSDAFQLSLSQGTSNLLMVDYVIDTRHEEVRAAYDSILASVLKFKVLGISNPFQTDTELTSQLISDVTPLENIFEMNRGRANADRIVDRRFKGKNDVTAAAAHGFGFGLMLLRFENDAAFADNILTTVDDQDVAKNYRLHTFTRREMSKFLFGYYKEEKISRATLLMDADENREIVSLKDLYFEMDFRDKSHSRREFLALQSKTKQLVPSSIYRKINWKPWYPAQDRDNIRFLYRLMIHPDALQIVSGMNGGQLWTRLVRYLKSIPAPNAASTNPFQDGESLHSRHIEDKYKYDLEVITAKLVVAFDPSRPAAERAHAFSELRYTPLFIEIAPGFLTSLIPEADLNRWVYFSLSLTADKSKPISFEYGQMPDRKLYEAATYIQNILNDRDVDLALDLAR